MKLKYWILLTLVPVSIALDQYTKGLVIERFALGESISVIEGYFNLTYIRNTGAAFGFMAEANSAYRVPFFIVVPFIALGVILYIFNKIAPRDRWMSTALSLVVGGAIGNLIDRIRYNYVIDFLDFHWRYASHFPAFNVADSAICVGVGMLMLDMSKEKKLAKT